MAAQDDKTRNECQNLLVNLKTTVEVLLGNQSTNVWNTYGGLSRLTRVVTSILCHRSKCCQEPEDCWNFILGLRVLVPTIAPWLERHRLATEGNANRSYLWIQQRLQEHTLSSYLKVLLDDPGHLSACFMDGAFTMQSTYADALLTCLRAVEDNQLKLLAEIDPNLLVNRVSSSSTFVRKHGRSPSLPSNVPREGGESLDKFLSYDHQCSALQRSNRVDPDSAIHHRARYLYKLRAQTDYPVTNYNLPKSMTWHFDLSQLAQSPSQVSIGSASGGGVNTEVESDQRAKSSPIKSLNRSGNASSHLNESCSVSDSRRKSEPCTETVDKFNNGRATSKSLTCIRLAVKSDESLTLKRVGSNLQDSVEKPETPCAAKVMRSPSHTRSRSDIGVLSSKFHRKEAGDGNKKGCSIPMSASLPNVLQADTTSLRNTEEEYMPAPIFRRPIEGQSLTSFLSSQDFRTCAELDKENAHFSISEALIAAIEQIKCNQMLKIAEEEDQESDDDEIKHLKQRIRIRRRQKLQEKFEYRNHLLSDGCTDTTTTTSQTPSPRSSSSEKSSNSDSVDPLDLSDGSEVDSKLSTLHESGLSLSMASLYSDADIHKPGVTRTSTAQESQAHVNRSLENSGQCLSAESVALNLLKRFSEKQLPKASDLEWLVSEQDAPQQLLPLPSSWPVSPDDADDGQYQHLRLRGNFHWAPPRPQIIFNVHPSPQRKVIMAKQNYRCAGCGTKVEQGFMKRFRYCEYLGKYFCQCCHNNCQVYIPGKILKKWDFNKYYVSNFSRDLLHKISGDPLFDVSQLNPALYRRVKYLQQVLQLRLQLYYIKDFISVCRNCVGLADEFLCLPPHLLHSPHVYSLIDLIQVKNGEMLTKLKPLAAETLAHIRQCQLCQARGFFCEFCKNHDDLIFPFQIGSVIRCTGCWSCFHTNCFVAGKCPKCARLEARKLRQQLVRDSE